MGTGCWALGNTWGRVGPIGEAVEEVTADEDETATRSHEGHMVRVVGGYMCM